MTDEKPWTLRRYEERLARVADGLRRLADEIERNGSPRNAEDDILWCAQLEVDVAHALSLKVMPLDRWLS